MRYALVLRNSVIAIEVSDFPPSYPPDQFGNLVVAIPCSEDVELGMFYNEIDNSFSTNYPKPEPTVEEQILILVKKSQDEVRQEGADMVMEELLKRGLIV